MSTYNLERLLAPRSVALVGGSTRASSLGVAILRNIRQGGFAGEIGLVNPQHGEIAGMRTAAQVADLPFVPELLIVTTPATAVTDIIAEAGRIGVAGAIIITSGLGRGAGSIAEVVNRLARASHMRLIGPNCLGMMMPRVKLNASFSAQMPRDGHLALISQSGAIAAGMVDWAAQRGVGFSGIVSIGDQLDVDIADMLDFFALDNDTSAILLYIEAVKDARKFLSAARAAARVKPVVVVKSGRMAQGAKAAATHTGALAGADAVYDAAFRRAGTLRVFDLRELFDCAEMLGRINTPPGRRLALLSNGGGLGILAVDRLVELGGTPADISPTVKAQLDQVLPPTWSQSNPIDIVGDADPARYAAALKILLADPGNDAILVMNVQTAVASAAEIAATVAQTVSQDRVVRPFAKQVLSVWVGADDSVSNIFSEASIPNFATEDDAVRGFMHLVNYGDAKRTLMKVPRSLPNQFERDVDAARRIVEAALADGRRWLDPIEVKQLLDAYQIPIVPTLTAADPDQAMARASEFLDRGQQVAVKVLSRDIVDKSDVGGVELNVADAKAVHAASTRVLANVRARRPDARILGVMIQPMVQWPKARELILGIADDPTFGPVIVFGRGGTAVEVINDKALALPPLDLNLAHDLIGRTRVSRLLAAYRGIPAAKGDEVALMLVKLSRLAADIPEIRELEINPLMADETGVLAVDARAAIDKPEKRFTGGGNAPFAVRPYPSEWERELTLNSGKAVLVRPLRPEDEPAIHEFLKHVSPDDLRLRFFAPIKEFSHAFVARLTQLDYARAMAFAAFDRSTGELIGVVRIHSDSIYQNGEYAILLRSDLKGKGLGWAMMRLLIEYARAEGLRTISGQVLRENTVMLTMCQNLGFEVMPDPDEPSLERVTLAVNDVVKSGTSP